MVLCIINSSNISNGFVCIVFAFVFCRVLQLYILCSDLLIFYFQFATNRIIVEIQFIMSSSESNELFLRSRNAFHKLIKHLESMNVPQAEAEKAKIDDIDHKLKLLRADGIVVNLSTKTLNTSILTSSVKTHLLSECAKVLIAYIKDKDLESFASMKLLMKKFVDKVQSNTAARTESELESFLSENLERNEMFYTIIRITENPTCVATFKTSDGVEISDDESRVDNKENAFYWLSCVLIYKEYKDILDDESWKSIKQLVKYSGVQRERLFNLVILCRWMLGNLNKVTNQRTENILLTMKRFMEYEKEVCKLYKLCNPYAGEL
jgi:hypothetical protein